METNDNREITFRVLEKDSVPLLLDLQEEAFAVLDDPDLLRRNTAETFGVCFNEKSLVLAVYRGKEIAGFGILYAAGGVIYIVKRPNLSRTLGFHELFHLFVLAGSAAHYMMVFWFVL